MAENPHPALLPEADILSDDPDRPQEIEPSLRPEDAGIVIVLGMLLANVVGIAVRHDFLASLLGSFPMLLLAARYTRKRGVALSEAFPIAPVPLTVFFGPVLVYLCVKVLELDAIVLIDHLTSGKVSNWGELFPSAGSGLSFTQIMIVVAVIAPIVEELVFRGFCYKCFSSWNDGWAAIFPNLIFAVFHHPVGIPGAFLGGVLFSIFSRREFSLLAGTLVHAVGNGGLVVFGRWMAEASPSTFLSVLIAIHIAVLIVLIWHRRYIKELWLELRSLWKQFSSRPQFGIRMRRLFKHWSYVVILLLVALTVVMMVAIPYMYPYL